MAGEIAERQAALVAEWLRVGYCQGNMNSDNSLLSGLTMDYGPFGFVERYEKFYSPCNAPRNSRGDARNASCGARVTPV